jgi:SET domain
MKSEMLLLVPLTILGSVGALQTRRTSDRIVRVPTLLSSAVSIERTATREIFEFQSWAVQYGVQPENGFCLVESDVHEDDWRAATSSGVSAGSRVLFVPAEMIISASITAQEFEGYADRSLQILQREGYAHAIPEFLLFLKVMMEYERGDQSPFYPWISSLPRKWYTAASMDDFCLSCLPPYLKQLCMEEQKKFSVFRAALKGFEYLGNWAMANQDLARFVYNVVSTRSFKSPDGDRKLAPCADMLNHGYPSNVELTYDDQGNCHVICSKDVTPGGDLLLNYGHNTNPAQLFATYGFLFQSPATYCKIIYSNPSSELVAVGYDPEKLLFGTINGEISPAVWDVLLYARLERKPEYASDKQAFFQAHMSGDEVTKGAIHQKYFKETCSALRLHVDNILTEIADLAVRTNAYDSSKHSRLPMVRRHNQMVLETFEKVKASIDANL